MILILGIYHLKYSILNFDIFKITLNRISIYYKNRIQMKLNNNDRKPSN